MGVSLMRGEGILALPPCSPRSDETARLDAPRAPEIEEASVICHHERREDIGLIAMMR
jgi:hypothetical protein